MTVFVGLLVLICPWSSAAKVEVGTPTQSIKSDEEPRDPGEMAELEAAAIVSETQVATLAALQNESLKEPERAAIVAKEQSKADALVARFPDSPLVQHEGGRAALQAGDLAKAAERSGRAAGLERAKGDKADKKLLAEALRTLGLAAYESGDYPAADKAAEECAALSGDQACVAVHGLSYGRAASPKLRQRLGTADALRVGKLLGTAPRFPADDAVKAGGRASPPGLGMALSGGDPAAILDPGRPHDAKSWLDLAERRGHPAYQAVIRSAQAGERGDLAAALKWAEEAVRAAPNDPMGWFQRAVIKSFLKDYGGVVTDASWAMSRGFLSAQLYAIRSKALIESKQYAAAVKDADAAIALDPRFAPAHHHKAFAKLSFGDTQGYLEGISRAAELDPAKYGEALRKAQEIVDESRRKKAEEAARAAPPPASAGDQRLWLWTAVACLAAAVAAVLVALPRSRRGKPAASASGAAPSRDLLAAGGPSAPEGYKIMNMLGEGGFATVYLAVDLKLNRQVALKVLKEDFSGRAEERARFLQEARIVASLRHANIIDVHRLIEEGRIWIDLELIDGRTVDQMLRSAAGNKLPSPLALGLLKQIAAGVDHAHEKGVLHRDLKPSNIMVDFSGGSPRVKVMDFGIARVTDGTDLSTRTSSVYGTRPYMAPEAAAGAPRRESDIYALGVCAFEMSYGRLPYQVSAGPMEKIEERFPLPSELLGRPTAADAAYRRALAGDAQKRYHRAAELAEALEQAAAADQAA